MRRGTNCCVVISLYQDWANPYTRPRIEEYPVHSPVIREACHSDKCTKIIPPEIAAPMWADGSRHYYVGELAQLRDGRYVLLHSWFRRKSKGIRGRMGSST